MPRCELPNGAQCHRVIHESLRADRLEGCLLLNDVGCGSKVQRQGTSRLPLRTIRESRKHARTGDKQAQWCDYLETLFAIGKPYHDGDSHVEPRRLWAWLKSAFFG